jgi:hypothetical protein
MDPTMPADPLLDLIDEHIAAIEATLPQDLTKIAAGDAPLGLERLVMLALEGSGREVDCRAAPGGSIRRVRLSSFVRRPT